MLLIIIGIILTFAILEVGLRLGGFFMLLGQRRGNISALKEIGACRIMCLGGSTTANGGEYSYPSQMEDVLNEKEIGINFKVINKGLSGCDSAYIASNLESNLDKYKPHIVVTMIGANDGCSTVPYKDLKKIKLHLFLNSFRVYKLAKLVYLHVIAKMQEIENQPLKCSQFGKEYRNDNAAYVNKNNSEVESLISKFKNYMDRNKNGEALTVIKAAIRLDPNNAFLYVHLGECHLFNGNFAQGEAMIKKALKMQPNDCSAIKSLSMCYRMQGDYTKAEEVLKRAIDIDPYYRETYAELATVYREQNCIEKLNSVCEKIISEDIKSGNIYGFLATSYRELGDLEKARKYYNKVDEFWMKNYKEATKHNYELIKEVVKDRGIQLVAVQYPLRNVGALKRLFDSSEGVIFVSNENSFKKALEHSRYEDYFHDNFAGDFGHCTQRGDRLLAENVAGKILKDYFNFEN